MKVITYFIALLLFLNSCTNTTNKGAEKYQHSRKKVLNVTNDIKEITTEQILLSGWTKVKILNNYLIFYDYNSFDDLVYIFNKDSFDYLTSTAPRGEGPFEITNIGHLAIDETNHNFYITDHGKLKIFSYNIDSILANPIYKPIEKAKITNTAFPNRYYYVNDTLSIGTIIKPTGVSGYNQVIGKWNMQTGDIKEMKYTHPDIEKKRVNIAVSPQNQIYAEAYYHHDLITICDFNGNLLYNIYGPQWDNQKTNRKLYYSNIIFCGDYLVGTFSFGKDNFAKKITYPTTLLVFNKNGDYIKTLEVGYIISDLCYDKYNMRIIMSFYDYIQFGYLDLDGII